MHNINIQACWKYVFKNILMESYLLKFLRYYVVVKFTNFGIREMWVQIVAFAI